MARSRANYEEHTVRSLQIGKTGAGQSTRRQKDEGGWRETMALNAERTTWQMEQRNGHSEATGRKRDGPMGVNVTKAREPLINDAGQSAQLITAALSRSLAKNTN